MAGRTLHLARLSTPLGPMLAGALDGALCLLEFDDRRTLESRVRRVCRRLGCSAGPGPSDAARRTQAELDAYFAGGLHRFSVPLGVEGTAFQRRAWDALGEIPYGATRSYAEQARALGRPGAARAVARANAANPIAILVPCHRLVGSDGGLTGYAGGLWRKRALLEHERGRPAGERGPPDRERRRQEGSAGP